MRKHIFYNNFKNSYYIINNYIILKQEMVVYKYKTNWQIDFNSNKNN